VVRSGASVSLHFHPTILAFWISRSIGDRAQEYDGKIFVKRLFCGRKYDTTGLLLTTKTD
jgi:hypothetical protein